MKKTLFTLFAALFCTTFSFAIVVPAAVQKAFTTKFPTATLPNWSNSAANYNVSFKMGGQTMTALFGSTGTWMNTEFAAVVADLPAAVVASGQKVMQGGVITKAFKVDDSVKGQYFRVTLKNQAGVEKTGNIKQSGEIIG